MARESQSTFRVLHAPRPSDLPIYYLWVSSYVVLEFGESSQAPGPRLGFRALRYLCSLYIFTLPFSQNFISQIH